MDKSEPMEFEKKRVLCVGLCCLDIVMECKSYPIEDSDQRCISHKWQRGGNASNNCTVFSEFQVPCEVLGALSYDIGGEFMKRDFELHNIFFDNCPFYEDCGSPTSSVWVNSENGSRTIVHSNKNMPEITFEDFEKLNLHNYKWIHFECRPSMQEKEKIINYINEWNKQPCNNNISVSIEIEKPILEYLHMLQFGEVIFISKDFAIANGYSDMQSAVQHLSQKIKQGSVLICAWGEKGASAMKKDGAVVTADAYCPQKIINTLGAGDTFVAATIMSLMKGHDIAQAIDIGCKVAGTKCGLSDVKGLSKLCSFL